jgi:large subunit ribosomal protein L17
MGNMSMALFKYERIVTTFAKAKALRSESEKLITLAKRGDLHARRQVLKVIADKKVVKKLFNDLAARLSDRNGGYTRVLKLAPRRGDGAGMAIIELVDYAGQEKNIEAASEKAKKAEKSKKTKAAKPKATKTEKSKKNKAEKPEKADKSQK